MSGQINNAQDIKDFVFAGKAHFTLRSAKTGTRFTYKVRKSDDDKLFFVSILNGPDNYTNYVYAGIIFADKPNILRWTKKSKVTKDSPAFKAATWFFQNMSSKNVEFYHEGKCGRCGRKLTVPESIERGLGPVCSGAKPQGFIASLEEIEQLSLLD